MRTLHYGMMAILLASCSGAQNSGSSLAAQSEEPSAVSEVIIPKKSGFYQISMVLCKAQAQLPERIDFPIQFEVFFDAFAEPIGQVSPLAATILLETDGNPNRLMVEGSMKTSPGNDQVDIEYGIRAMEPDAYTIAKIHIAQEDENVKAKLTIENESADYKCGETGR